jgi:Zn-dependent protease/CBS domain-containing protein
MSWSWRIAKIAGVPIKVHWTFLILLAWVLIASWSQSQNALTAVAGVAFIVVIFGCIVLHELGHAVVARHFGVKTSDITLLPIGGVARLERMPERPSQELQVALAGPAVNVVIAAVLYFVFGVRFPAAIDDAQKLVGAQFMPSLLAFNVFVVLFNLLPAFPMDGGRVLRALLAMRLPYPRATRLAASVGQLMAILFGLAGLIAPNVFLLLIALFVWIGAESEAQMVEERVLLKDVPVRTSMLTEYHTVTPDDTLGHAAELLLAGTQHDFPVVSGQGPEFAGVLTRSDLMAGLARGGAGARVAEFTKHHIASVEAESSLAEAVARLREGHGPCLQVLDQGKTVGLLTLENVAEFLMVRAALADRLQPDRSLVAG